MEAYNYRRLTITDDNPITAINTSDHNIVQGLAAQDAIRLAKEKQQSVNLEVNGKQIVVNPNSDINELSKIIFG